MNKFFTWLFSNEYYQEVVSFAEKCKSSHKDSFDVFFDSHYKKIKGATKTYLKNEFDGQKDLFSHKDEICVIQVFLDEFKKLKINFRLGVNAFLTEKRLSENAYSSKVQVVSNRSTIESYDSIMNQFERIKNEYGYFIDIYYNRNISAPSIETAKDVINSLNAIKNFKRIYIDGESRRRAYPKTFEILKIKHNYNPSCVFQFYSEINNYCDGDLRVSEEYINAIEYLKSIRWAITLTDKKYYEEKNTEQPSVYNFTDDAYDKKRALVNFLPCVKQMSSLVKKYPKPIICIYFGFDIKFTTFDFIRKLWNDYSVDELTKDLSSFNDYVNEVKSDFPQAVTHFLKHPEKFYSDISLGKDLFISSRLVFKSWEEFFSIKDKITPAVIDLLCDGIAPKDDDFSEMAQCKRKMLLQYLDANTKHFCKKFVRIRQSCLISPKEEHIRTILDSEYYGKRITFPDDYSFEDFCELAIACERNNTDFDSVWAFIQNNTEAIKGWNVSRGKESVIYTNNYTDVATKTPSLMQYIEHFNRDKAQREAIERQRREEERRKREEQERQAKLKEARELLRLYYKEVTKLCPSLHPDLTDSDAILIVSKKTHIIELASFNNKIRNTTSSWSNVAGIPLYYFYHYYPTKFSDITPVSRQARTTIWNFKDGNLTARQAVINIICQKLRASFTDSELRKMTFVCIPASNRATNESRYKAFANEVCTQLNMRNAYDYISITKEKTASHLGGTDAAEYSFNTSFFRDSNVILFDDVVTRGHSMSLFRRSLENIGANVIFAMSIGRTYSDYYGDHRTPHPWTGTL